MSPDFSGAASAVHPDGEIIKYKGDMQRGKNPVQTAPSSSDPLQLPSPSIRGEHFFFPFNIIIDISLSQTSQMPRSFRETLMEAERLFASLEFLDWERSFWTSLV